MWKEVSFNKEKINKNNIKKLMELKDTIRISLKAI
jgi:hypothetical protein